MSPRKVVHHRALWISDVHLGSPNCKASLLTAFLRQNESERLYLVGDIFDGWKLKAHFYWTQEQSRVVNAVVAKARSGTEVYYLTGNHDAFMRQFVRGQLRLGRMRLANEVVHTTADGRRLLVLHGDAFDEVIAAFPRLSHAGDFAYDALIWANQRMRGAAAWLGLGDRSLSVAAKTRVKDVVQYLSGFDEKVLFRCKQENLQGVVCGHTHHAEVRSLRGGITSYNCGDWVESCTALSEDFDGRVRIVMGTEAIPPARPVPHQPSGAHARASPRKRIVATPAARGASRRTMDPIETATAL